MTLRVLKPGTPVPEGAVRVHFGSPEKVLLGRGPCEKESLSLVIYEHLISAYEHWTDDKYGDNPDPGELVAQLVTNAKAELKTALIRFVEEVEDTGNDE